MQTPTFFLEGVVHERDATENFEGPLSVILMLLSKNKIEIRDIQISLILDQYLEFIAKMEEMDLEVASEFVQMAAHLLYIKTSTLLRADEEVSELEQLIESLEQFKNREAYGRIKLAVPGFGRFAEQGLLLHIKEQEPLKITPEYAYRHEAVELLRALGSVFARGLRTVESVEHRRIVPRRIVYNVREKSREIINWLGNVGSLSLRELFERSDSRSELVATFISVLELCSGGSLLLTESEAGIIVTLACDVNIDAVLESISEHVAEEED